jgi:hypothetical protein
MVLIEPMSMLRLLRLPLGSHAVDEFRAEYLSRVAGIDAWEALARGADHPDTAQKD